MKTLILFYFFKPLFCQGFGLDKRFCSFVIGFVGRKHILFFRYEALVSFVFLFCPFLVFAEGSSESFPLRELFFQLFNFSLFSAGLVFLVRKPLQVFFHKRQEEFIAFENQALKLEKEKRKEYEKWEKKRQEVTARSAHIRQRAREEGERFAFQQKEALKNLKIRLEKSSDFVMSQEREKAKRDLLAKWEKKLIDNARLGLELEARRLGFHNKQTDYFSQQLAFHAKNQLEKR